MSDRQVKVGVGVFVIKNGQFLMMQRRGAHGAGTWAPPGGHLEFSESFEDTARREVLEETGLAIKNVRFGAVTNDLFAEEGKHYVTIWMLSDYADGVEKIMEPEKCIDMRWCMFETLPRPLFLAFNQLLSSEFLDRMKTQVVVSHQE